MNIIKRITVAASLLLAFSAKAAVINYDEAGSGDISGSVGALDIGTNTVTGTLTCNQPLSGAYCTDPPSDLDDSFLFDLGTGLIVTSYKLTISNYQDDSLFGIYGGYTGNTASDVFFSNGMIDLLTDIGTGANQLSVDLSQSGPSIDCGKNPADYTSEEIYACSNTGSASFDWTVTVEVINDPDYVNNAPVPTPLALVLLGLAAIGYTKRSAG